MKSMTINLRFTYLLLIGLLMGCSKSSTDKLKMSEDNPFNVTINQPIAYASVTSDHIDSYVAVVIDHTVKDINSIKTSNDLSFDNTFAVYDKVLNNIGKAANNSFMLYWVSTDSLTRAKGINGYQKLDSLNTDITSDKKLFDKLQSFANSEDGEKLEGLKKRLVTEVMDGFKQSGVNLSATDLVTYKQLSADISELSSQFSTNMNTADEVLILEEAQMEGLPENFKDQYRKENGSYEIPIINATSGPMMSNAKSSEVRKMYAIKKANLAADKNLTVLDSLISKRYQLGKLMGYDSYAAYNLRPKMAKTPQHVWDFLSGLSVAAKDKALQEIERLKTVRNADLHTPKDDSPLNPWDRSYYNNELLKTTYNVDNEKMRDYLPMEACLEGMFILYQELLGLQFKKVDNPSVWHEDVQMYEVYEGEKLKGRFYLDLFPRANKETWYYAVPLTYGSQSDQGYEIPVAMLLGNFTKPTEKLPSLLSFRELSTLFHEFGHIMNCMSYEGEYFALANTKADFVEAMSQIFENWIEDYDILSSFAKHYETGEVFPKDLYDSKQRAKNVSSGASAMGGVRWALYDMNIYDRYDPKNPIDTDQLWKDIDAELGVESSYIEGTHPQASWIHINTNPVYVYGYIWSEVYAQDMFTVFKKNGLRDSETGMNYRKLVLANGAQKDVVEAVEEFLGRPSNNQAYIESLGLEE